MAGDSSFGIACKFDMETAPKQDTSPITRVESFEIEKKVANNELAVEKKEVIDISKKPEENVPTITASSYISIKQVREFGDGTF